MAKYGGRQATTPDVWFKYDQDDTNGSIPHHRDTDRAALLSALAPLAGVSTQTTLAAILAELQAATSLATTMWTDNSGAYYVRRDVIDEGTGAVTVSFTTPTGTPVTPGAGLRPAANEEALSTEVVRYVGAVAGTGYSVGDMIERIVILDANTSPPTVVTSAWVNLTTGAILGTAPTIANLTANPTALPVGAATSANQVTLETAVNLLAKEASLTDFTELMAEPIDPTAIVPLLASSRLTPYRATSSVVGETTVAAATATGASHRVYAYEVSVAGPVTVTIRNGTGGAILKTIRFEGKAILTFPWRPDPYLKGSPDTLLSFTSDAAVRVDVELEVTSVI